MKTSIKCLLLAVLALGMTACEDEDEYNSRLPKFGNGIVTLPAKVYPGDTITLTAVQTEYGQLLDRTVYSWTSDEVTVLPESYTANVTYSKQNPSCRVILPNYTGAVDVTFTGKYNISGKAGNERKEYGDGKKLFVIENLSPLTGMVTVKQRINITSPGL